MRFSSVVGQHTVKQRLIQSFREKRLAHALLLAGPEGSGNLALALAFANYVACPQRNETDSCGQCRICRSFDSLQYPDLHFAFPYFKREGGGETTSADYMGPWRESLLSSAYLTLDQWQSLISNDRRKLQIGVDEASYIIQRLVLKSFEGGYKFMIIWLPEMMNPDCANKLLKTLEEPPDQTLLLLVSENPAAMLATVLSRTQLVQVPSLADTDIMQALVQLGVDEAQATGMAHYAHGNWYLAMRLAKSDDPNRDYFSQFQQWMRLCYSRDAGPLLRWCEEMHELSRDDLKSFLLYALSQVRQNALFHFGSDSLVHMSEAEKEFAMKFSKFINETNLLELHEELSSAYDDIRQNGYAKLVLFDLSLRTHHLLRRQTTASVPS